MICQVSVLHRGSGEEFCDGEWPHNNRKKGDAGRGEITVAHGEEGLSAGEEVLAHGEEDGGH